jgi:Na+/H+ antiporter NhaA/protein-disulfide isomerase
MSAEMPMTMAGKVASPLRAFLNTESASARVLVGAVALALLWANLTPAGYESFWTSDLPVRLGPLALNLDLRTWVNSGLMTLFFLVVGLEARREFDLGDLREHRRLILPVLAGLTGMVIPVIIYLVINRTGAGAHGWGAAMSTDTALALGVYSVAGRGLPERIRTFVLTVFVVDDVVSLVVIAVAYSQHVRLPALGLAVLAYAGVLASTRLPYRARRPIFTGLAILVWGALLEAGIDPVVSGLAVGLATSAYVPRRDDLTAATTLVRLFREQPTPELAESARRSLTGALSANDRLRHTFHTLTSYAIVPLFALANAGMALDMHTIGLAVTAPVTIGIFVAYVFGKPIAVFGASWLTTVLSRGRIRPQVGWAAVLGSGTIAGVAFTVSLLIASLAFTGDELAEAKIGVLAAAIGSSLLSTIVYRLIALLPAPVRTRALLGTATELTDLVNPVDTGRDHVKGPADAVVTVVEYGDFECPWTGMIAPTARELLAENTDIRYVWRHLPLEDVHPHAQLAAEAAEAAGDQGMFWPMHDLLLTNQQDLHLANLLGYARSLELDVDKFSDDLLRHRFAAHVAQDVDSADLSGVAGTPTFFVNDRRHEGPQDLEGLNRVIAEARDRVAAF